MVIIDAGDRDHPHAEVAEVAHDVGGEQIAGSLKDDADVLAGVTADQRLDHSVGHAVAQRLDQRLAAGQDNPPAALHRLGSGSIEPRHPLGQIGDDARKIRLRLGHDTFERVPRVGPETVLVAMAALAMARPAHDVIERFHGGRVTVASGLGAARETLNLAL